ncbi:Ger(x)C family spore germination protein [Paenibacillus sp. sgz500958]|uniref:Ger(x)C family spore germination protein n=1 Tax=Paenibacillus sp. sgz500958 TaxID=3242475 RepID=UPI0036D41FA1
MTLFPIFISGCWDGRELSELGIASGSAYDWNNNEWVATYQIINPSSGASGMGGSGGGSTSSPPFLTFTVTGRTVVEAMEHTSLTSTRQLYPAHSRITIFSERLARKGIDELIDVFLRKTDARETVYVFISKRDPGGILQQLMQLTKNQGAGIQLMIEQESKLVSYYPGIRLFELARDLSSESGCAVIPEIKLTGKEIMDKTTETGVTDLPSRLALGELAVLKGQHMIGWLTQKEAFGLTFLTNKIQMANIAFISQPAKSDTLDATFSLKHSTTSVKPVWEDDHYVMDVRIKGSGILTEVGSEMNLTNRESINNMEKSIEKNIQELVENSWKKVKEINADVTGFAVKIHRSDKERWKKIDKDKTWNTVFQEIEIRPHVHMTIERMGLSNKSFKSTQH